MRKIKYRIWDKKRKVIYKYITTIKFDRNSVPNLVVALAKNKRILSGEIREEDKVYVSEFELMQYTGLKDQNGKEIYCWDVVVLSNNCKLKYIVVFREGQYMLQQAKVSGSYIGPGYCDREKNTKIIGNIHENPELL